MRRSLLLRSLIVLASSLVVVVVVGCSETPNEGDLPPPKRTATPEESEAIRKKIEKEKIAPGSKFQAPPGVNIPKQ